MNRHKLAECVGLWLAEGYRKSKTEICVTNNEFSLISLFNKVVTQICEDITQKPYLYVYSPKPSKIKRNGYIMRNYVDSRANKPYYIYKLYSTQLLKKWKRIVTKYQSYKKYYSDILKGFFAGEGNIKYIPRLSTRTIRISQGKQDDFLEQMLNHFGFRYTYQANERSYVITSFKDLMLAKRIGIANLHLLKKKSFDIMISSFKEEHYLNGFLKKEVYKIIKNPQTTTMLSKKLKRTKARIYDVLHELKHEGKANYFRVRSNNFWINTTRDVIIISKVKYKILKILKKSMTATEIAKRRNKTVKSTINRLKELKRRGLITKSEHLWKKLKIKKKILIR